MQIRTYIASDAPALAVIFNRAVSELASAHYPPEQIAAWLDGGMRAGETHVRCSDGRLVLVAAEDDGHIGMLFVAPEHAGQGVASALYRHLEDEARQRGLTKLHVEASEMARPFFLRHGFALLHRRGFDLKGTPVHNYAMAKSLNSVSRLRPEAPLIGHVHCHAWQERN